MKPIIIATDFSGAANNAADYAADMALHLKKEIILLHVIEMPVTVFQVPMTEIEFDEIQKGANESLNSSKKKLIERTGNKINISAEIQYGVVENKIKEMAQSKKPFAIVMGIKNNPAERFFLGSNVLRLLHHSLYPVLIIPENVSFNKIKNISIASDLSSLDQTTSLLFIKEWLNTFHVSPNIINVKKKKNELAGDKEYLSLLRNSFSEFSPKIFSIHEDKIAEGIADFVSENKTDLLVVLPEKHGLLESILQSSHSKQIILHSALPVLSVFTGQQAQQISHAQNDVHHHNCGACNGNCANRKKAEVFINDKTHS